MSQEALIRTEYPPGVPCWVDTTQPDPRAALEFYRALFGWEFEDRTPEGSESQYYVAQLRGRDVAGVGSQAQPGPATWNSYVAVENADDAAATVADAGGAVLQEPFDVPEAGRMGVFADPSGAAFCVWQADGWHGAELVNEPGTWNFSELNTRDRAGAIDFYGRLFGWEVSEMGFWRRPGYGDFLAQGDPGIRERQDDVQAPEGFADAVAWLVVMEEPRFSPDTPPHWSVTLAVDDADAVAERATELGGTVLAPPTDMPWVRLTVLRDPQGATFTASKFVPPES